MLEGYATVLHNPRLRSLELAWGAAITAEWAHFVALGVFAYQANGSLGVGLVGFIRLLPAAGIAPFASSLGDRIRREQLLVGVSALGASALSASAVAYTLPFALALVFWGVPIALLAGPSSGALALALVGVVGAANSLEDVAGFTLLQRIVDDDVLTRVLGALWGSRWPASQPARLALRS